MQAIVLTLLIVTSAALFLRPLAKRFRIVRVGGGTLAVDPLGPRLGRFIREVLLQVTIIRERPVAGFMHALVFWGFLAFGLETLDHFAGGYGGTILGHGAFHDVFSAVLTVVAIGVIVGMVALAVRRFVLRPASLGKLSLESLVVTGFILALMVTYLLPEFGVVQRDTTAGRVNWWIHALVILAFLPLIVHSKHLHLVLSPATTFYKAFTLAPLAPLDFEKEEFGAEKLSDLSRHTLLGAFTCVECGRCQDHCPAFNTGKRLNPKELMLRIEAAALADVNQPAVGENAVPEEMLWQCTTCGACTDQCPVGIDQVVPILDLRRGLVANGSFPDTFTGFFKNLETSGNPWAYSAADGEAFIEKEAFPTFEAGKTDVLYWMGCLGRYDDKYRKVARAFATSLSAAGITWGVLPGERCTGDAARRAGNEFLFTMLAEQNVELLNAAKPKKIVATCPHCVRTLSEYVDFGLDASIDITHHSAYLAELTESGALPTTAGTDGLTYHDPCYLSRYAKPGGVSDPRDVIRKTGHAISEPARTGSRSFCCGAGGAMVFAEEKAGKRVNHERVDELLETGASEVAVGCPFCRIMISDGLADRDRADVPVRDIAELVAERLPPRA